MYTYIKSSHVHPKYAQFLFVNYTSVKMEAEQWMYYHNHYLRDLPFSKELKLLLVFCLGFQSLFGAKVELSGKLEDRTQALKITANSFFQSENYSFRLKQK